MAETLRLDKFLWHARFAKTRSLAQTLAGQRRFRLNGRVLASAHAAVRAGDILVFAHHGEVLAIEILTLPDRRGPASEARACYRRLDSPPLTEASDED